MLYAKNNNDFICFYVFYAHVSNSACTLLVISCSTKIMSGVNLEKSNSGGHSRRGVISLREIRGICIGLGTRS